MLNKIRTYSDLTISPNLCFFSPLIGYVTASSLERESVSCNLIAPQIYLQAEAVLWKGRISLLFVTCTCCRTRNTSMKNVPEPNPTLLLYALLWWTKCQCLAVSLVHLFKNWTELKVTRWQNSWAATVRHYTNNGYDKIIMHLLQILGTSAVLLFSRLVNYGFVSFD